MGACPLRPEDQLLRLFVAVDLPGQVREALARLQGGLRSHDLSDLRWVRPQGIHLTLKFLGETPAGRVAAITEALAGAIRGRRRSRLALGALGTFGGRRRPRVLWLDITGDIEHVQELQAAVEEALVEVGFPPEERDFSPHLTLARVPQPGRPGTAERIAQALESVVPPRSEFDVREVVLMRSTLQPGGAVYERLAAFPLE
ncbi:MAG: RNA 2',3'-cyclic phosphodiesterase [Dehalococcoidia bacterium]|nr:MAG: RNA 2',3'-cyclic phosphodiesterase [Dehalococcoidia bacterium]